LIKSKLTNQTNQAYLDQEIDAGKRCLRLAQEMSEKGNETLKEFDSQQKILFKNKEKINVILDKFPLINKILGSIKFHRYKEKIVLGVVLGLVAIFFLSRIY
jgi:hypothetical protein